MEKRLLESIPCEGLNNGTHIDVEVTYNKGGRNYLSGGITPRGYYLRVTPVKRENGLVSFNLFSGSSQLLMEASRYSAKQFERAVEMGRAAAPELVNHVKEKETAA